MSFDAIIQEASLLSIMVRFGLNLIVLVILILFIYYRFSRKEEFVFSYFMLGSIINLLCSLLGTVNIQIGMALGLFAIFAILRFRTVTYTVKDMTYIFTVIGVSVINSQANIPPPVIGAIAINSIILAGTLILELFLRKKALSSYIIKYSKTDLLKPGRNAELLNDLTMTTGFKIEKVKILEFDSVKNNAELEIFYLDTEHEPNQVIQS
jgi:hypothetical protein